ncbi:hypothetical protein B0J17DRAFT_632542 [Rhizoctonia solani]|nr:hypothetical protein B0J17DRAFT_632542 [Rhizoctonia solani]
MNLRYSVLSNHTLYHTSPLSNIWTVRLSPDLEVRPQNAEHMPSGDFKPYSLINPAVRCLCLFIHELGLVVVAGARDQSSTQAEFCTTPSMRPGTYKIVNLKSGTAITGNHLGTVGWRINDSKHQQWFILHSGEGYQFKNVATGGYLAVAIIGDSGNRLYCSGYPTTWSLVPNTEYRGYGIYSRHRSYARSTGLGKRNGWRVGKYLMVLLIHLARNFYFDERGEEFPALTRMQEALASKRGPTPRQPKLYFCGSSLQLVDRSALE